MLWCNAQRLRWCWKAYLGEAERAHVEHTHRHTMPHSSFVERPASLDKRITSYLTKFCFAFLVQLKQCCKTCCLAIHRAQGGVGKPTSSKRSEHVLDMLSALDMRLCEWGAGMHRKNTELLCVWYIPLTPKPQKPLHVTPRNSRLVRTQKLASLQVRSQNLYLAHSIYRVHYQNPFLEPSICNVCYISSVLYSYYACDTPPPPSLS
jgi:hypothetical protein